MSEDRASTNVRIDPGWPHFERYAFSPAIARDGWLFVSGMTASGPGGSVLHPGDIVGQTDVILERLGEVLHAAGCDYEDVSMTRDYIVTTDNYSATADVRRRYFRPPLPAATGVIVAGLLRPGALIEIEAYARLRD